MSKKRRICKELRMENVVGNCRINCAEVIDHLNRTDRQTLRLKHKKKKKKKNCRRREKRVTATKAVPTNFLSTFSPIHCCIC